jgi:glycosyltransferase involved in cell wall biosynthesis
MLTTSRDSTLSLTVPSAAEAEEMPFVSIVVRSYKRIPNLCQLLRALLSQDYPRFEIVVVEQTELIPESHAEEFLRLSSDPRVRVLSYPPLGGAAARNVGVEAAKGDVFVFIDDDDLPRDDTFLRKHVEALDDPNCLGVSGKLVDPKRPASPYSPFLFAVTRTLSYDPVLKMPLTYVQHDRRCIPVDAILGSNASLRRSAWQRFGGWDVDTNIEDEVSFCFRALQRKKPHEYFAFDPRPVLLRNKDVPGGLDKRQLPLWRYQYEFLRFVHTILWRYHPVRVFCLYPIYLIAAYGFSVGWIFANSARYRSLASRVWAPIVMLLLLPAQVLQVSVGRLWKRLAPRPRFAVKGSTRVVE